MSEAFIYLWYDAPNKMYYLGKHRGEPDDSYTHSSSQWESFTKNNIPEGVTRRILTYGTDEEMCILEHKLLVNRKNRCWDKYYNESLGDPRYIDQTGKNSHRYKHGKACKVVHPISGKKHKPRSYHNEHRANNIEKYRIQERIRGRRRYAKVKTERQGVGTLEAFLR